MTLVLRIIATNRSAFIAGRILDTLARSAMWKYGMDYRHGTGHGIGYFTTVHEGLLTSRLLPVT